MSNESQRALVAYVPAIHKGYVQFLKKHALDSYVLGRDFIDAFPRLNRDIRALDPQEAATAITSLGIVPRAGVVEQHNLVTLEQYSGFVLPHEDVSHDFAEKHLKGKDVTFENVFLRWDKLVSEKEKEVPADRIVSSEAAHQELMLLALEEAQKSADWWRQIGGLIVKGDKVLYKAHISYFPSDLALDIFGTPRSNVDSGERPDWYISMHAEANVIAQAAKEGTSLDGSIIYTTTFPCVNCARLIATSGIKQLFYTHGYSVLDAEDVLRTAGVEIILVKTP